LQVVLPLLAAANFEKVFVAFDACRNPVGNEGAKSAQEGKDSILPDRIRGLARTDSDFEELARKEYAVLFSTSQGAYAYDTTVDGLSPFTKAFSLALAKETSFLKAMVLTKQITEDITKGAQSPDIQIKWNSDLSYARSPAVTNSAAYLLNNQIAAADLAASPIDLSSVTTFGPGLYNDPHTQKVIAAANRFMQLFGDKTKEAPAPRENPHDEEGRGLAMLNLRDDDFGRCHNEIYNQFFWYSDILGIELCYLKQLGHKAQPPAK
jgi:hypothetical protein